MRSNGVCCEFRDAGTLGFNNPTDLASRETEKLWPGSRVGVVVSLGAGLSGLAPPKPTRGWTPTITYVKPIIDDVISKLSCSLPTPDTVRKRVAVIINKLVSTAADTQLIHSNVATSPQK